MKNRVFDVCAIIIAISLVLGVGLLAGSIRQQAVVKFEEVETEPTAAPEEPEEPETPEETDPEVPADGPADEQPAQADPNTTSPTGTQGNTTGTTKATTTAKTTASTTSDPTAMSKSQLVTYFNNAMNKVRTDKPGYTVVQTDIITNPSVKGGLVSVLNPLIPGLIKQFMPGDPETSTVAKGTQANDKFGANESAYASKLRDSDVTSISAKKSGANYVVTVNVKDALNPTKGDTSSYGRVFDFKTPQQLMDDLAGTVEADTKNVKLGYHSGRVILTVNAAGQVTAYDSLFKVDASVASPKIKGFSADTFTADQQSTVVATQFVW